MANFFDRINPFRIMSQFGDYGGYEDEDETPLKTQELPPEVKVTPKVKESNKNKKVTPQIVPIKTKPEQLVMGSKISSEFPIPLRQPRKTDTDFERKVVGFTYRIVASKTYGYPSGQDPLLILFIEDRARLIKDPKVSIDSIREFLLGAGIDDGGKGYERTRLAIKRYFNCQFLVFKGSDDSVGIHIDWFKAIHLKGITSDWKEEDGNYVILSDDHFKRVMDNPIPYEMEMFRLLSHSAGACALYRLIAPKAYRAIKSGPIYIGIEEFIAEMGGEEYSEKRKAKQMLFRWKKECDVALESLGLGTLPIYISKGKSSSNQITVFPKILVRGAEKSIDLNVRKSRAQVEQRKIEQEVQAATTEHDPAIASAKARKIKEHISKNREVGTFGK